MTFQNRAGFGIESGYYGPGKERAMINGTPAQILGGIGCTGPADTSSLGLCAESEAKIDAMVELFVQCRDWVKVKTAEHEKLIAPKKEAMQRIEGVLQSFLDKTGQIRGACKTGTFYTTTRYNASIKDKQEFARHVIGTENWDLLDWKVNVQAARDFELEMHTPLPGVAITSVAKVGVRRPGASEKED